MASADKIITDPEVIEQIREAMPLANFETNGLSKRGQSPVTFQIPGGKDLFIELLDYGIYVFTSLQINGVSLLFQKAYYVTDLKILMDPSNIIGTLFNISQEKDGGNIIKISNLMPSVNQVFFLNRL